MELALAAVFAAFIWWFATGAILYLDGLPRSTFGASLVAATLLATGAFGAMAVTRDDTSAVAAYVAFAAAIVMWGWIELTFLTGRITGPRKTIGLPHANFWRRFRDAFEAIAHHELAILLTGCLILALTWGQPNPVAAWTFIVLWAMRTSAKLNLFLGVRNDGRELLPAHLAYLASHFARRPVNLLFPVSIIASTTAAVLLLQQAMAATGGTAIGTMLVASLLVLGIVEHWLMVLPLPATALWGWGLKSRDAPRRG